MENRSSNRVRKKGKGLDLLLALIPTDDLLHFLLEGPDLRKGWIYKNKCT